MNILKFLLLALIVLTACSAPPPMPFPNRILQHDPSYERDYELARQYAPVFYFHPKEIYRPQSVEVILKQARLRQSVYPWLDITQLNEITSKDLIELKTDKSFYLDVWDGDEDSSKYSNYTAHKALYERSLNPTVGGPPMLVYAHVVRDEVPGHITIQYWVLYFYNDWFNKHEGDWEMVQVILDEKEKPQWVVLSQHHDGTRRSWKTTQVEEQTHPVAYVALGSHANYFVGDENYITKVDIGNTRVALADRTQKGDRLIPEVRLIPDREQLVRDPAQWPGAEWLLFRGSWGERSNVKDWSGPLGPADKGEQWEHPLAWGTSLLLDTDVWYANSLRVQVTGGTSCEANMKLMDGRGNSLPRAEYLENQTILHGDPSPQVLAIINAVPNSLCDVVATLPIVQSREVIRFSFPSVQFSKSGHASLDATQLGSANLVVDVTGEREGYIVLNPTTTERHDAVMEAADVVWMSDVLPANQLGTGIGMILVVSLVPIVIFAVMLGWSHFYERKLFRAMSAAMLYGAIPAFLIAIIAQLFINLPLNLISPRMLEGIRLIFFGPVVEESLKALAVFYVYKRYKGVYSNVLDGFIFGLIVGYGFAAIGNFLRYARGFALWGFDALDISVIAEGIVYATNHSVYTGCFGAMLGFARVPRVKWMRWGLPILALALSIGVHTVHNLLAQNIHGLNVINVLVTLGGFVLVVIFVGEGVLRHLIRRLRTRSTERSHTHNP